MSAIPPPYAFGVPEQYSEWRPNQDTATLHIVDSPSRFSTEICPTGFGKSLMYVVAAVMIGGRAAILTSTKGLQDQLMRDFGDMGAKCIKGRNAYRCIMLDENDS